MLDPPIRFDDGVRRHYSYRLPSLRRYAVSDGRLVIVRGLRSVAKKVGTISVTIGRYERDEINPSIDIATKIADAFEVSLDYRVVSSDTVLEKSLVKKISDIQKLPEDQKNIVTALAMLSLRDHQAKKTYAH